MNIAKAIKDNNTTISAVAAKLGIGQSALSQCINNNSMSLSRALAIADILNISVDELCGHSPAAQKYKCPHCGSVLNVSLS